MRQYDVGRGQSDVAQVLDIALPRRAFDHRDLVAIFRSVRVNHYAELSRKSRDSFEQSSCATDREPRGEAISYATISPAIPTFQQIERSGDRIFSLFVKGRGNAVALIHHAFSDRRSNTGLLDCAEDGLGVIDGLHCQRASGPALDQLRDA